MNVNELKWKRAKLTHPIGSRVNGVVVAHKPFGVFVEISDVPFQGLIQITDFKDEGVMTMDDYPPIGSQIESVVLGFKEAGNQIWLGVKPSQLKKAAETITETGE